MDPSPWVRRCGSVSVTESVAIGRSLNESLWVGRIGMVASGSVALVWSPSFGRWYLVAAVLVAVVIG